MLSRLYDFLSGTRISSSQVDAEFNQLVAKVNELEAADATKVPYTGATTTINMNNKKVSNVSRLELFDLSGDGVYFGCEEDPATGTLFFSTYNSDGSFRSSVYQINIDGNVRFPSQAFVNVETTGTLSIPDNTATKITNLTTEIRDKQNEFASSKYTAKVSGVYQIRGHVEWATNTTGRSFMRVYKNGVTDAILMDRVQAGEKYQYGSLQIELTANDYIEFYAFHDDSGAAAITLNKASIQISKVS